jgi:hypothetical protein
LLVRRRRAPLESDLVWYGGTRMPRQSYCWNVRLPCDFCIISERVQKLQENIVTNRTK